MTSYFHAINARDFDTTTAEENRDTWGAGALRHLIAALDGAEVTLVLDRWTGHTVGGVRLIDVRNVTHSNRVHVLVEYGHGTTAHRTAHPIDNVGMILAGASGDVFGTAVAAYRAERRAAKALAWAAVQDHTGGISVVELARLGELRTRSGLNTVTVAWHPYRTFGEHRMWHHTYRLSDLAS